MSMWTGVRADISVSVSEDLSADDADALAQSIVKDALLADERIEYVEVTRTSVLFER